MTDLLKLAIEDNGGAERRAQISRVRAAASITGAIWVLKGQPGMLHAVALGRDPGSVADDHRDPADGPAHDLGTVPSHHDRRRGHSALTHPNDPAPAAS